VECRDHALVAMKRLQVFDVGFGERLPEQASRLDRARP
jgi:hypothetical protein